MIFSMADKNINLTLEIQPDLVEKKIIKFIQEQTKNVSGAVVGLSGGIDSAVCAHLCARALGNKKTFGLILPSATTEAEDIDDALKTADALDIKYSIVEIDDISREIKKKGFSDDKVGMGNISARIRMILLRDFAHKNNLIVCGTGHKSELDIGYFTKNGDGGVDILPIGDLYKTQVRTLAKHLGVIDRIIEKPPSANLWEKQTDEEEMGITYELLDKILYCMENKMSKKEISENLCIEQKTIENIEDKMKKNAHKINPIPVLKI